MDTITRYGQTIEVGQKVRGNWGAYYPDDYGVVAGFEEQPPSMFFPDGCVYAVVEWHNGSTSKHEVKDIRPSDWELGDGGFRSPIGVYLNGEGPLLGDSSASC